MERLQEVSEHSHARGDPRGRCCAASGAELTHSLALTDRTGAELVAKAFAARPPAGRIVIHEKLVEDGDGGPLANQLVHLDMLVWTEGQQYRVSELTELLERSGFAGVERLRTAGYWSVVHGAKP